MENNEHNLNLLFDKMWKDYCQMNPHAEAVYKTLIEHNENVVNDHIALRTLNLPAINIKVLAQHFLKYGYKMVAEYIFKDKKLTAMHFEHSNVKMPKVFISQLELNLLTDTSKHILETAVQSCLPLNTQDEGILYSGRAWKAHYKDYQSLYSESEYAAWFYAHGFRPNHFTVYLNELKELKDIYELNTFLKSKGFRLNSFGGEVKGTPQNFLEQSSTMAGEIPVQFVDGVHHIPGCYYEFARRYPMSNGQLYQGFVESSANKIFESTHR